uniref:Peroxidasin-like n=1 Tax=Gadus morhua TaxID=8049 RepID=A0A8C4ZRH6_GADMO
FALMNWLLFKSSCPLELIPKRVVERHGASLSVLCRPTTTSAEPDVIGWESPIGKWNLNMPDNKSVTWNVENFEDWTFEPFCFGTFSDNQCSVTLPITLYKTPDTVSISVQNHSGPLQEGRSYTLQCDVFNVAPVAALTVSWLWKGEMIQTQTYDDDLTKTPENVSSTWEITAFRNDSGNVSFGCSAEGNPPPEVKCKYTVAINARETTRGRQHTVSITRATSANGGIYNCVATNTVGTATRQITLTITPLGIDCRVIIN